MAKSGAAVTDATIAGWREALDAGGRPGLGRVRKRWAVKLAAALACAILASCLSGCVGASVAARLAEVDGSGDAAVEGIAEEGSVFRLNIPVSPSSRVGALLRDYQPAEIEELTPEETAKLKGSAATGISAGEAEELSEPAKSLFRSKAKAFYYREALSSDARALYDAMMTLLEDPTDDNRYVRIKLKQETQIDDAYDLVRLAYFAMVADHPEYFWLYQGVEGEIASFVPYGQTESSDEIYCALSKPYDNYETEMRAFNDAVDEFMESIDTSLSDADIALAIHDKLMGLVTYDYSAAEDELSNDLAHTAYGALVAASSGKEHFAVCDGYSLAYEYLLQQAGLEATVIFGSAGNTETDIEGHAWNAVKIDNVWNEVDVTWDDSGSTFVADEIAELESANPDNPDLWYYYTLPASCLHNSSTPFRMVVTLPKPSARRGFRPKSAMRPTVPLRDPGLEAGLPSACLQHSPFLRSSWYWKSCKRAAKMLAMLPMRFLTRIRWMTIRCFRILRLGGSELLSVAARSRPAMRDGNHRSLSFP